jgi:hypothetical protein
LNGYRALLYTAEVLNNSPVFPPEASPRREQDSPDPPFRARLKFFYYSAIFFALLQSACSAFIALSGFRLFLGVGALAFAAGALRLADRVHLDILRIPMMVLALFGSVLDLLALRRIWSLRRRPASAWRQRPVAAEKRRSERIQFAVSVLTLMILAAEIAAHHHIFHRF